MAPSYHLVKNFRCRYASERMTKPLLLHLAPILRRIPRGYVTTYGDLARAIGKPGAARAVGQALKRNPNLKGCPCFLVVRSDGKIGGYAGGKRLKVKRLREWGINVRRNRIVRFRGFCNKLME